MRMILRSLLPRLLRSGFLVAGVFLCTLGAGNWIVGGLRLAKYEELAVDTRPEAADSAALRTGFAFTDVSEGQERHNIALAKLQYYSVVLVAGQILLVIGLLLILTGYLRLSGARTSSRNKTLLDSA
jgi:hypothetical protein